MGPPSSLKHTFCHIPRTSPNPAENWFGIIFPAIAVKQDKSLGWFILPGLVDVTI